MHSLHYFRNRAGLPRPLLLAGLLIVVLGRQNPAGSLRIEPLPLQGSPTVYLTGAEGEPKGSILKLEDLGKGSLTEVVSGLANPQVVHCGPDGRLYFTEIYGAGRTVNRIWRANADGTAKTLVAEWGAAKLRPDELLFGPNGDLFFGTVSNESGQRTQGIWKIPGAAQSDQQFSAPQQVIGGDSFSAVPVGHLGQTSPCAFLRTGQFAGDLLIFDNPSTQLGGPFGRVLRAPKPNFSTVQVFINGPASLTPKRPQGMVITGPGDVLISDFDGGTIFRFGSNGAFKAIFASLVRPNQIAIAPDDTVYVTNAAFMLMGGILTGDLNMFNAQGKLLGSVHPTSPVRGVTVCAPK